MPRYSLLVGLITGVLAVSAVVFFYSLNRSMAELDRRGRSDLALASDRLVSGLFGFRQLTVTLAADPRIVSAQTTEVALRDVLLRSSDISGALDFVLLDNEQRYIASAAGQKSFVLAHHAFVRRALDGALGRHVGVSPGFDRRVFYYAAPVFSDAGPVARVVVAIIDLEAIEADFRGSRPAVYMTDQSGIIFFSNRSELIFRDRNRNAGTNDPDPGLVKAAPFVDATAQNWFGRDVWFVSAGRYLPQLALHVDQPLPVIGMQAEALIDLRPALADAALQAAAAGMLVLLFGAVTLAVAGQRRILARTNAELERRVDARTQELRRANQSLRSEVAERQEAEKALKRAQRDLIQAGKLSALGKMTAGISHELNQPLMAIQSFSDNAATFLERGQTETAHRNMQKVSGLAHRMARIIQNFRAFARQEKETVNRVALQRVVQGAVELAASRVEQSQTDLHVDLPDHDIFVQGGEVRLQQVVLNLVSNAMDAMVGSDLRRIDISVQEGQPTLLIVRDTGPGLDEPDKVFEPFYSTKEIGEAEGMGLGLSISYGLVQSFGGKIRGENARDGGAIFTVELQPWNEEAPN